MLVSLVSVLSGKNRVFQGPHTHTSKRGVGVWMQIAPLPVKSILCTSGSAVIAGGFLSWHHSLRRRTPKSCGLIVVLQH